VANVLEKEDIDLFYKLYSRLLCFVNKQVKIFESKLLSPNEFVTLPLEERVKIRDALYSQKEYIGQFIENENAQELNSDELAIINSWKHFEKGEFFIYKHLKKHSIFIDDSGNGKAFAVSGIFDPLEEMFPHPPVLVETVLIPFKDCIIYDGLIRGYSIHFGSGIRSGIRDSYEKAKHNFGLITQLPLNGGNQEKKDDIEKLKFYMKNKSNRDHHWDEIVELSLKNKQLGDLFYQEMGKVNASYFSKQLKRIGLEKKWFGIIDNTVVASGVTEDQLQKNITAIVPKDKVDRVYIFKT
jgi:hypothetical protein